MKYSMNRWENWELLSSKGTQSYTWEQLITREEIEALHQEIKSLLKNYLSQGQAHLEMQVYLDRSLRNDLISTITQNPPQDDKSLIEWIQFLFGDFKLGVIHNFLEKNNNTFSEKMAAIIHGLMDHAGVPLGGLSFSSLLENNGFSPKEIRKMHQGHDLYYFNIGPAEKIFYIWEGMEVVKEHIQNQEALFDKCKMQTLKAGDVLFIPSANAFTSKSDELSLCIEMEYKSMSKAQLNSELTIELDHSHASNKSMIPPINSTAEAKTWNTFLDMDYIEKQLKSALRRKIYALQSNLGIRTKAKFKRKGISPNRDQYIRMNPHFPIILDRLTEDKSMVFARGNMLSMSYNPQLSTIIDRMMKGEKMLIQSVEEALMPHWKMDIIYSFITDLYSFEAIEYC